MHDYSFISFSWNNNTEDSTSLTFQFPTFSKLELPISFIKQLSTSLCDLYLPPLRHHATTLFIIDISQLDYFIGHKHFSRWTWIILAVLSSLHFPALWFGEYECSFSKETQSAGRSLALWIQCFVFPQNSPN